MCVFGVQFEFIFNYDRVIFCINIMANRRLERLGLDPLLCERLVRGNITTARELLSASPLVLMLLADIDMKEVTDMLELVSEKVASKPQSALMAMHSRQHKKRYMSSGIDMFDTALKGGILIGSITEICGAPGAGKTQFCLNCTLQAIGIKPYSSTGSSSESSGGGGVIYIDTELKFDPNRLIQIATARYPESYSSEFRIDAPHQIDKLLEKVKVLLILILRTVTN